MTIAITINPDNVINSPISTDTSTGNVKEVTWCVRTRIAEPTSPSNFNNVEEKTTISITLNLQSGISEIRSSDSSSGNNNGINGNTDSYQIVTYECDSNSGVEIPSSNTPAYTQGSTVSLCFKPNTLALNDGITIESISWFQFVRSDIIQSVVIDNGRIFAPALTTYDECKGNNMCSISTQLSNNFFYSAGTVLGRGEAIIADGNRRLLRKQSITFVKQDTRGGGKEEGGDLEHEHRQLQGFNPERPLEITIRIDHSDQVYGAEAYECDSNNRRVDDSGKKKVGDSIRICVRPNTAAVDNDVYLRQVASFNFRQLRSGIAQFAVEPGGNQAPDGKTLLTCTAGSSLCFFQTELKEKFFNSNEKVLGRGQVLLQFGTDTDFPTRRTRRHLQMSDADFAGATEISIDVNIQRRPQSEIDKDEKWDDEAETWWKSQPKILRFIYIMIPLFLLTFLICCCAVFFCGLCPGWFPATERNQKEVHHEEVVNIEYVREGPGPHGSEREASTNHWGESGSDEGDDPSIQEQAPASPVPSSPRRKSSRRVSAPESMKQIEAAPTTPRSRKSVVGGDASPRPASSRSPRPGAGSRTESTRSMAAESVSSKSPRPGRKSSKVDMTSPKRSPRPGRKSSVGGGTSSTSPRPGRRSLASDTGGTRTPNSTRRNTVSVPNSAPARSRNSAIKSPASGRRASANPHYSAGGKRRTTGGLNNSSIPEVPF